MDAKQEVAQRLRGWMKERGLSQKEVADEIGVYATSLNKVALGESNFGVPTLIELAKRYEIDLNAYSLQLL